MVPLDIQRVNFILDISVPTLKARTTFSFWCQKYGSINFVANFSAYVAAQDKNTAGGRGQKQGGRGGDRERGERQDNRRPPAGENREREDRPPRGQNTGGRRQRLPSKEKDRVRVLHVCFESVYVLCI